MNDPHASEPVRPEWLAAYVDGELCANKRLQVERWLVQHPAFQDELRGQRGLSPRNDEYWRTVSPPPPPAEAWDAVLASIERTVSPPTPQTAAQPDRRRKWSRIGALSLAATVAALVLAIVVVEGRRGLDRPSVDRTGAVDQVAADANQDDIEHVFQIARDEDVELIQLPEAAAGLVVVGKHPLADVPFLLASAGDVQVLNYGRDDQGNWPDIGTTSGPDASMLWAPPIKP